MPEKMDAKDLEIQRLKEDLQAAKDYSQICEDEGVELRRQLFDMTKEMKKLYKELECLKTQRSVPAHALVAASRKRTSRKSEEVVVAESGSSSDGGSACSPAAGGDHNMDASSAPRRSTRRAGLRPAHAGLEDATVPKKRSLTRKDVRPSINSLSNAESEGRLCPDSSKKKKVAEKEEHMLTSSEQRSSESECAQQKVVLLRVDKSHIYTLGVERAVGETRHVSGGAGGMGEHPDELEQQAPATAPCTAEEQMQLLSVLGESNLHLQAPWNVRMRAIQQLRLLLADPALLKCNASVFVEKLLPALVVQTSDARSQIVREACGLVISILPFLADFSEDVARVLLPQLWKLAYITIKVMSESGNKCLLSLAESLPIAIFVDSISEAICDPHAMCRSQAVVCLTALLQRCDCRDADVTRMCAMLNKLFEDVSADVRAQSKSAFEMLVKRWPAAGEALLSQAPEHVQRMLKAVTAAPSAGVSRLPSKKVDIKGLRLAAMHKLKVSEGVDSLAVSPGKVQVALVCKENVVGNTA